MALWRPRYWDFDDWGMMDFPHRIFGQNFGNLGRFPMETTGASEVVNDKEKFQVNLDVSQFKPEEIKVREIP